jgi:nucleotide-binding universal stress UspA family protein
MDAPFKKLGLAVTFSPTGQALLKEATRLKGLFNAELTLIHAGKKDNQTEEKLNNLIKNSGIDKSTVTIIWVESEPSKAIIKSCEKENIDLLIIGALEKEPMMKYYIGSVARKIMREASTSVLILRSPSEEPEKFKKFCVSTDYSYESEKAIKTSFDFALLDGAEEFLVVRDFNIPALSSTIIDSGDPSETKSIITQMQNEEEIKMNIFIKELGIQGIKITTKCILGREGWEAGNFARENNANIFVVCGKTKKFNLLDRLFPNELEFLFKKLPTNLLIIR